MIYSSELIKGTLKTIVLQQLKQNGKMYGYEITQRVKELSKDRIAITEGALYPTLHALEADGLVA
jgi:DNA-binding PadR family transcriptional regulator